MVFVLASLIVIANLRAKLNKAKYSIVSLIPSILIISILFGVWPLLQRSSSYLIASITFTACCVMTYMVLSVSKESESRSSEGLKSSKAIKVAPAKNDVEAATA